MENVNYGLLYFRPLKEKNNNRRMITKALKIIINIIIIIIEHLRCVYHTMRIGTLQRLDLSVYIKS